MKKSVKALTILMMLAVNLSLLAAEIIVTDPRDDGREGTLRYALAHSSSGDVIKMRIDRRFLPANSEAGAPVIIPLDTPYVISSSVSIDGTGIIFQVSPGNPINAFQLDNMDPEPNDGICLQNVTVQGGAATAVAVYQGSINILDSCLIEDANSTDTGGGVSVSTGASLTVQNNCIIINNTCTTNGGGIFVDQDASLTLQNGCTVDSNSAAANGGGVFVGQNASLAMQNNCVITNNTCTTNGGGIFVDQGGSLTTDSYCIIGNNISSGGSGGGIYTAQNAELNITKSRITNNTATSNGGGIYSGGELTLLNSTVDNDSAGSGGGIYLPSNQAVLLQNSTIAFNKGAVNGGGICLDNSGGTCTINACTIALNSISIYNQNGGGIFVSGSPQNNFNLYNSIVAGNMLNNGDLCSDIAIGTNDININAHNNIYGQYRGVFPQQLGDWHASHMPTNDINEVTFTYQSDTGRTGTLFLSPTLSSDTIPVLAITDINSIANTVTPFEAVYTICDSSLLSYGASVAVRDDGQQVMVGSTNGADFYTLNDSSWSHDSVSIPHANSGGIVAASTSFMHFLVGDDTKDTPKTYAYGSSYNSRVYSNTDIIYMPATSVAVNDAGTFVFGYNSASTTNSNGNTTVVYNTYGGQPIVPIQDKVKIASQAGGCSWYGSVVAVSTAANDNKNTILVGNPGENTVYAVRDVGNADYNKSIQAPPNTTQFGQSVAASPNDIIIGAQGNAFVYTLNTANTGSWSLLGNGLEPATNTDTSFGCSVDVSSDGNTFIVGAKNGGTGTGAAYVYKNAPDWTQYWKLMPMNVKFSSISNMGQSVALSRNGSVAAVGCPDNNFSTAYIFFGGIPTGDDSMPATDQRGMTRNPSIRTAGAYEFQYGHSR